MKEEIILICFLHHKEILKKIRNISPSFWHFKLFKPPRQPTYLTLREIERLTRDEQEQVTEKKVIES